MPAAVESTKPSPNAQTMDMELSSADKKRNKLGYHRTSVACVHCRRRKIRCLVAPDDAQGRCENCIRLRKDCQFFPVDQQPPVEKKPRAGSRADASTTDLSTSSTSPPSFGQVSEQTQAFFPYHSVPLSAAQDASPFSAGTFSGNPMVQFTSDRRMTSPDFMTTAGPSPLDASVRWDDYTAISDPQMLAAIAAGRNSMAQLSPGVWSPDGTPVAPLPSNSPIPAMPMPAPDSEQSQSMTAEAIFAMQPSSGSWQAQTTRPVDFATQPEMASFPDQFPQQIPADLKQRFASAQQHFPTDLLQSQGTGPQQDMQGPSGVVQYAGIPPMGLQTWQDVSELSGVNVSTFPMYSPDGVPPANSHTTPPPMGHGGRGHGLGQGPQP